MSSVNYPNGPPNGVANHTVTAMSRWSCISKPLPAADKVRALHVYDFDNTLFKTPLPNHAVWNGNTIGLLCSPDAFVNGGWWHDPRILAATGEGIDKEEPRGFPGWWNERVVELVHLSNKQKDVLCVLLTGRAEHSFADLIKRIFKSRNLDFDLVGLKPAVSPTNERFNTTMHFKQLFLESLMETYKHAEEIRIYEDRPKHVRGFRDFLGDYNRRQNGIGGAPTRGPLVAEVIPVAEMSNSLDPVVEVAEVLKMINDHNRAVAKHHPHSRRRDRLAIKKTVFFTSYMIESADSKKLAKLANIPDGMPKHEVKIQANSILICPRPCPSSILEKVGGMGSKMKWMVTGTACFENSIWAACLRPVPDTAKFHTDNPCPLVVLALRRGARPVDAGKIQNWQPVPADKAYVFETTVKEKTILRVEPEDLREDEYESLFANKSSKRKHGPDDEYPRAPKEPYHNRNERGHHAANHGRGGQNQGRGNFRGGNRGFRGGGGRGGSNRGRGGRGGGFSYKSLDDVGRQQGADGGMDYDDHQSRAQHNPAQNQGAGGYNQQSFQQYGGWPGVQQQPPSGPQ